MNAKLRQLLRPLTTVVLTAGVLLCAGCASSPSSRASSAPASDTSGLLQQYRDTVANSNYILHALGGIDGTYAYTNSIDALRANYENGYRLFEADVSFTSDHHLVLAHSARDNIWKKVDWEKRLGQPYDPEHPLATLDAFQSFTIQERFQATTFAQLLDFMETHPDMFVMVDAGNRSYDDTVAFYQAIVDEADGRDAVLQHLIAGGQNTAMFYAARSVYDFPIYNLYYDADDKRESALATPECFLSYCEKNHILSYSIASDVYTEEVAEALHNSDLIGYVFTINDKSEAERLLARTGTVVGTDFLRDNT